MSLDKNIVVRFLIILTFVISFLAGGADKKGELKMEKKF